MIVIVAVIMTVITTTITVTDGGGGGSVFIDVVCRVVVCVWLLCIALWPFRVSV